MSDYLETSDNELNLSDQAPARCRFEGSCIHRCKFRTTPKGMNPPPVPRFLPAETPDCEVTDGIVMKERAE